MGRTRPDHRRAIVEKLQIHGPLRFAQLQMYLEVKDRRELDYDLRCLRTAGVIRTAPGMLWELRP